MFHSLSHPSPFLSTKPPNSPRFLPLPTPSPSLRFQNPNPRKPSFRSSTSSSPTTSETLSKSTLHRISEKLRSLGYLSEEPTNAAAERSATGPGSPGEIFIPTPQELPKHRVGYTIDASWSTPEHPVPQPGSGMARVRDLWRSEKAQAPPKTASEGVPSVAELMIPPVELRRLRTEGIRLEKRLKVGKAGVTEGIVNGIHERWRRAELVKIKCEDLCRMNMKRTHETLERKTGGLVVWRSGGIIVLYRGANYKYPYFCDVDQRNENIDETTLKLSMVNGASNKLEASSACSPALNPSSDSPDTPASSVSLLEGTSNKQEEMLGPTLAGNLSAESPNTSARSSLVVGVGSPRKVRLQLPGEIQLEEEADRLLDGLGPRYSDWWGYGPLPVDADLLPAIVSGFRKPFRLLPFGIKPKLTDREMTILRRLGRPLPCHFALGRNRNLQGLAVAMTKLWEKCELAKIAIKRGAQNTNSELMAEELKQLTGGTLLSRDKEFIVFYRGKDFLPPAVSVAIEERRNCGGGKLKQNTVETSPFVSITAFETKSARAASINELQERAEQKRTLARERKLKSVYQNLEKVETKLSQALEKKEKAEKLLADMEKSVDPSKIDADKEAISEEERYMLRKVGLRMKPFLLLGRRGVFDGTVENMHLHWKYRELVKIIARDRCIGNVTRAARILEAESGGILVAVERVSKGHAIIVYRGKNYRRPANLRPETLLNKREAMKQSLDAQRHESLKLHVLNLSRNIDQLKNQLVKNNSVLDSVQLTKLEQANAMVEINDQSGWSERDKNASPGFEYKQENVKEVYEVRSESLHPKEYNCIANDPGETINTSTNVIKSVVPLNSLLNERHSEHKEESCESEVVTSFSDPRKSTNISYSEPLEAQALCSTADHVSHDPDININSSSGVTQGEPELSVNAEILEHESGFEIPVKAAPLSNRERLALRKQALSMRKRPVLAVGRNNVISGVAKTIKTHFKKHPLAIVNIKGRAKGTSVQELIFELEQATGSVLVSREPNKVILYRGWGEGETPLGMKGKDVEMSREGMEEAVSAQLMEAIRVECGLQNNKAEQAHC